MRHTRLFKGLLAIVQASFLGTGMLVSPLAVAPVFAKEAADIDQCANDPAPSSPANGCSGAAGENGWVNGNLNASKSVFLEGDSIPYRIKLTDLTPSSSNAITIEWDTTKSGKHALDYVTDWNESVLDANPCLGVSGCSLGSFDAFAIPADPQVTGAGVTPVAGSFALFGGTINSVSSYFYSNGAGFGGDKSAGITITFTPDVANPVLAWGGHIASRQDWGPNNSAVAITGSPYHTRLLDLNGSGGNQDRSLKEDAVIFPGSITIIKQATPEGSTSFGFAASPAPLANFNLVDDGTSANTKVFPAITSFTTYTVAETLPGGWQLDSRACQTTSQNGGSTSNSGANGITINLKEGENVTCTFSNSETPNPSLNITKTAISVDGDNSAPFLVDAAGDVITYRIVVANTGNVTLHGVVVSDTLLANLDCDPGTGGNQTSGFSLAVGASLTCSGSYTVSQADIDTNGGGDGDIDNVATADSDETGPDTDDETVPLSQSAGLNIVKDASVPGGTANVAGEVISYTITVQNTGNQTLTGVTVTDPFISNLTRVADLVGDDDNLLEVGETWQYTASHTVTQAELDDNGGGDGLIDNTATADSDQTGPDADDADVPIEQNPSLNITKSASVPGGTANVAGEKISYVITVANTGNVTLTSVVVADPYADPGSIVRDATDVVGDEDNLLEVGETWGYTAQHTVTQAEIDSNGGGDGLLENTATADSDQTGPDTDDANVPVGQAPSLGITKDDGDATFSKLGDVIVYTIVVTNTGNTTLTNVEVTDANAVGLDCDPAAGIQTTGLTIPVGGHIDCSASHTIVQADLDAGSYLNTACADDGQGGAQADCDDESTPGEKNPALSIDKVDETGGFDSVGDVIDYSIVAKNTGNVTLHGVVITDEQVDEALICAPSLPVADLAPGAEIHCTAFHTVTQEDLDAGSYFNEACVDDTEGPAAEACDDVTTGGDQNPELSIVKEDDGDTFSHVGDVIDYVIIAWNSGNVTLHGVVVTDAQVSDLLCLPVTPVADLAPGELIICSASHTITQDDLDAGSFFNEACVDDTEGPAPEACGDVTTVGDQNPELSITKEATEAGFDEVGDVIHYTIKATNTGNVTLHDVVVTDAQVTDLDCTPDTPVDLAPGEEITCTASHTVVEADFDTLLVFNQACVDDANGEEQTGAAPKCDDVSTPGQELQQETDVPTQPPTDGELGGGSGRPADGAWLLVIGLAILLGGIVLMTPNRRRSRR